MCTAITFKTDDHYFGRNLDYTHGFGEKIIITPRNYPFHFHCGINLNNHYALIGTAVEAENYPLYFDATNEVGLSMAGLNFPDNACYFESNDQSDCIAPFELIPWILGKCKSVEQCRKLCENLCIVNIPFNEEFALTPLHWIVADQHESIVIESVKEGLKVYEDPYGVLTNNPPFPYHLYNICNYINITAREPVNRFAPDKTINTYSLGMGAIGLPGDNSSASRFIRAAFTKLNSKCEADEHSSVAQFFRILNSVSQIDGCTAVEKKYEKTLYSSCCNTDKGIYYYTTYENPHISAVHLHHTDLDSSALTAIPLNKTLRIFTSL